MATLSPAGVLRQAADWLGNDPTRWGRDAFIDPLTKCRRCAAGAISWVLAPLDTDGDPMNLRTYYANADLARETVDVFAHWLMNYADVALNDNPVEVIAEYNDAATRVAGHVIAAMRDAADEWDARKQVAA